MNLERLVESARLGDRDALEKLFRELDRRADASLEQEMLQRLIDERCVQLYEDRRGSVRLWSGDTPPNAFGHALGPVPLAELFRALAAATCLGLVTAHHVTGLRRVWTSAKRHLGPRVDPGLLDWIASVPRIQLNTVHHALLAAHTWRGDCWPSWRRVRAWVEPEGVDALKRALLLMDCDAFLALGARDVQETLPWFEHPEVREQFQPDFEPQVMRVYPLPQMVAFDEALHPTAEKWRCESVYEAREWSKRGVSPKIANALDALGVSPRELDAWLEDGCTPGQVVKLLRTPRDKRHPGWDALGFRRSEAWAWQRAGISPRDAETAARWRARGWDAKQARSWIRDGVRLEEALRSRELGLERRVAYAYLAGARCREAQAVLEKVHFTAPGKVGATLYETLVKVEAIWGEARHLARRSGASDGLALWNAELQQMEEIAGALLKRFQATPSVLEHRRAMDAAGFELLRGLPPGPPGNSPQSRMNAAIRDLDLYLRPAVAIDRHTVKGEGMSLRDSVTSLGLWGEPLSWVVRSGVHDVDMSAAHEVFERIRAVARDHLALGASPSAVEVMEGAVDAVFEALVAKRALYDALMEAFEGLATAMNTSGPGVGSHGVERILAAWLYDVLGRVGDAFSQVR